MHNRHILIHWINAGDKTKLERGIGYSNLHLHFRYLYLLYIYHIKSNDSFNQLINLYNIKFNFLAAKATQTILL